MKDFWIGVKLTEWWMIIQVAVTQNDIFKKWKRWFVIFKQAHRLNQWSYGFKIFLQTTLLLKASCLEGLLNWNKTDWMASKHLRSCNLHQLKNIGKDHFWLFSHGYQMKYWSYGCEISKTYPFIRSLQFEGFSNRHKNDGMVSTY